MRYFELRELIEDRDINAMLLDICFFLGKEDALKGFNINSSYESKQLFLEVKSINAIDNIEISNDSKIFSGKDEVKSHKEREWIGVKNALEHIKNNYNDLALSVSNIKKIHHIMMRESYNRNFAGEFKSKEVFINCQGKKNIPTSSIYNTPYDVQEAVEKYYNNLIKYPQYKIAATVLFVSEFLAIHPFNEANGRMGCLILVWLLARLNIKVVFNVSLAKYIREQHQEYDQALCQAMNGHLEGDFHKDFIKPWTLFYLKQIKKAYQEINQAWGGDSFTNKEQQIIETVKQYSKTFSRQDITTKLRHIDPTYVSKILDKLVKDKLLVKTGKLKGTKYQQAKQ